MVLAMSSTLMMSAAVESSFFVFRILPAGLSSVSVMSPRTSGMTATPVSKPESPSASFGKRITAIAAIMAGLPCCANSDARQRSITSGCRAISAMHVTSNDDVQREIRTDEEHGEGDRLPESSEKDRAERQEQRQRDDHRVIEPRRRQRILDQMRRGVGRRQRDRDHEVGGRESEQTEDEHLALPAREQTLEDEDAALPVRAHVGDAAVHRQRAEERHGDEHERRHRRERAGGEKRDARLIGERGEIVDAREAHDLPPVGRVRASCVGSDG